MDNRKETRRPDSQYQDMLRTVLTKGELKKDTPQGKAVRMIFGELSPLVYPIANGFPVINERKMGWKGPIGEMCAFINGIQDFEVMKTEFGVPAAFWDPWVIERKTIRAHAKLGHLGDASYGPALARFPMADNQTFDQFQNAIDMLCDPQLRDRRTIYLHPWIPYWNSWGGDQRAVVSPCHGWMHFRVIDGELDLLSWHRSADLPLGFPNDMISYSALLLMMSQVTGIPPRKIIFQFGDAHIYEDQFDMVEEMIGRKPLQLPRLWVDPLVTELQDFRSHHFELRDYNPHPAIRIPGSV